MRILFENLGLEWKHAFIWHSHNHTSPRSWSTGNRTPCTGPRGPADLWTFVCSCTVGRELFYGGRLQVTLLIRQLEDIPKLFSLMLKAMFKKQIIFLLQDLNSNRNYLRRYVRMCVFFTALCFTMAGRGEGAGWGHNSSPAHRLFDWCA